MDLLMFIFLVFLGWPAAILLAVLLHKSRSRLRAAGRAEGCERARYWEKGEAPRFSLSEAMDLAILRLDLDRRHAAGLLPTERHVELCAEIGSLWMEQLGTVGVEPGSEEWWTCRARAFDALAVRGLVTGSPPWAEAGEAPTEAPAPVVALVGPTVQGEATADKHVIGSPGAPVVVPGSAVATAPVMDEPDARGSLASDRLMEGIEGPAPRGDQMAHPSTPSRPEGEFRLDAVAQRPFGSADPTRSPALPLPMAVDEGAGEQILTSVAGSTGHGSFSLAAEVGVGMVDRVPASAAGPMSHDPFPLPTAGDEEAGVRIDAATSHARRTPGGAPPADRQIAESHALRPAEPGLLERTLKAVSGWHALVAPFLVQNIGWFIGGFCFVAGSVFLVTYTTGFGKAFAIWGAMLLYTLLLIGGGYGLRRRRPELRVSSEVLMALGALLVPLTIAAATRLIAASSSFGFVVGALMAAALSLGLLYPAMLLASGVMDRRLAAHPRLFLALSATQLAVPLLDVWRSWAGIALMHLVVLGLLCNALLRFTDEWLQAIFVERRKSAIYAAGTLFYGALVAFVHATWGAPDDVPLPHGYSGPFLMAACGLLFYVDARLKHWSAGHAFLSRFTFAIYGLSVLALALASGAPVARGMTLVLAIGLYGFVVWRYLTLTPLYLLLGCVSWLYALLVLRPFDPALHLLLALPGLAGLYALNRSVLARRAARLGEIASRTLGCALLSLTAWSLWNGEPGLTGLATGAAATGLWYGLNATRTGAGTRQGGVPEKLGSYAVMVLCTVTLAYAPRWPALAWATQLSLGLLALAGFWIRHGLGLLNTPAVASAEVPLTSGLVTTALAVAFAVGAWSWPGGPAVVPVIVLAACGLLFYTDTRLEHWTSGQAFLSRLRLCNYGLSVLALALASGAPVARGLTLVLAIGLYGFVVWHYLTLTPLYFLLGCVSWLYALVVLRPFDPVLHLLLALPGLAGLYALNRSVLARRSARLGEIASRALGCALFSLTAWSLWNGEPGLTGLATGAAATGLWSVLIAIRAHARTAGRAGEGGAEERLGRYGLLVLWAVTLAYAPRWPVVAWATQFSLGLAVLAALWTERGLAFLEARSVTRAAALLDGGLLATALAAALALGAWFWQGEPAALPAIVLVISGMLFFRQGLALYLRPLIYAALGCFTAAGMLTKLAYFPELSAGGLLMALATLSWVALFWLERAAVVRRGPTRMEAIDPVPVTLLWRIEVLRRSHGLQYERLLSAPLTQAMVVLWLAGIGHLLARLAEGRLGWAWVLSAGLGAMVGVLFAARFRRAGLVTVAVVLGVGAWLAALHRLGFTTTESTMLGALTAYALIAWAGSVWVLRQGVALRLVGPLCLSGGYGPEGGRVIIERTAHVAAMGLCLAGVALAIGGLLDGRVALDLDILPVPAIATGFWCASAWRYRKPMHAYLMLASLSFAVLVLYGAASSTTGLGPLAADPGAGLVLVLLALGFLAAARVVETGRDPTGLARTLYPSPLVHTSLGLTLIAVGLQAYGMALGHQIEGTTPSVVLAIGGGVLLWANQGVLSVRMDFAAIMLLVLALVCAELAVFHDGLAGTALADPGLADLWVMLAIVSLLLALGADAVHRWPRGAGRLSAPLQIAAGLCYGSVLVAGLVLAMLGPWSGGTGLGWVMLALAVALPPLRWPIPAALLAPVRGLGVALFLSAALGSGLMTHGLAAWLSVASPCWAYLLWSLAVFMVPRFNARWPRSALDAGTWPWLGLGFIAVGLSDVGAGPGALALRLLVASGYLFLLLGRSARLGWAWGAVSGLAAAGGVSISALLDASMPTASAVELVKWLLIGLLVWANVLLYAGRSWRRYGSGIASRMGWGGHDLSAPFTAAAWLGIGIGFLALGACVWDALLLSFPGVRIGQAGFVILLSLTLALSMGRALRVSRTLLTVHGLAMHGLVVALAGVWLGGYLMLASWIVHPPLAVAGFALLVYTARSFRPPTDPLVRSASLRWCGLATLMAIATLVVYWNVPVPERLLTLAMAIGLAGGLGVATGRHAWRMAALGMMIVFLHAWPFAIVPVDSAHLLLPWYALELAALAAVLERLERSDAGRLPLLDLAARSWPWLCGVAVIEWSLHFLALADALAAGSPLARLAGTWDGVAASIAAASILWIGLRRARLAPQSPWVYVVCLWAGALGSYLRLLLLGLGPVTLWDTAALIVVAYGLVFLQRFFDSRPLLHLAYLMPLAVLMTVPLQLASVPASLGLVTAGSVYLLMRRTTETATPLYLGVLALNAALYLWIPGVAREAGLIQVYLIPASLSVLILLHLHRREIKPSVAHSTRLGAVTMLYASATADVFLTPGLGVFALALFLSLVGAAFGIALRIRALLYAGVTFLIVNVLGQLVRFYPDGRLAKAVMLMAVGASITAAMVWFNLKREMVLRQVRVFRADLASWG